jgi:hypothetical protein
MLLAILICTDDDCDVTYEAYGTLEELDVLVCDGCGCTMQPLGYAYTAPIAVAARQ